MGPWTINGARKVLDFAKDYEEEKILKSLGIISKNSKINSDDNKRIKCLIDHPLLKVRKQVVEMLISEGGDESKVIHSIREKLAVFIKSCKNKKEDDDFYVYDLLPEALDLVKNGFGFEIIYKEEDKVVDDTPYLVDVIHDMGGYTATYSDGSTESGVQVDWGNPFGLPESNREIRYIINSPEEMNIVRV